MIVFSRTMIATPGMLQEGKEFLEQRRDALEKAYNIDIGLYARFGGAVGQMSLVSQHETIADLEAIRRQVIKDTDAGNIPTPEPGMVIPGSVQDGIWLKL